MIFETTYPDKFRNNDPNNIQIIKDSILILDSKDHVILRRRIFNFTIFNLTLAS